jgi:hypothetical protein
VAISITRRKRRAYYRCAESPVNGAEEPAGDGPGIPSAFTAQNRSRRCLSGLEFKPGFPRALPRADLFGPFGAKTASLCVRLLISNFVALPETSLLFPMSNEVEAQSPFRQPVATFEHFIAPKREGLRKTRGWCSFRSRNKKESTEVHYWPKIG